MKAWFSTFDKDDEFESTPKYDGNAVNLIYRNGKILMGITRGDKYKGRDVTAKLIKKIPNFLQGITQDVEVRGEVVMPTEIFYRKYSQFKNPRNFVAGFLNTSEMNEDLLNEIEFMAVEVRVHDGDYEYPADTQKWLKEQNFNTDHAFFLTFKASEFEEVYTKMKDYREKTSPFQLDGFVIKSPEGLRKYLGEKGHHPNWAIAVKFPPKEAESRILGYKWNIGTSGNITPIFSVEPIDLDGTTVKNVAAFNIGYIIKEKLYPGARVIIAKSGDIIPQIMKVLEPGEERLFNPPTECACCGESLVIEGIHLLCPNDECEGKMFKKFRYAIQVLKLDKFGSVTCKNLYDAGFVSVMDIFDSKKFNKENLIATGYFKEGKTLDSIIAEIRKIKLLPMFKVILTLGFDKVGNTSSKQLAKMMAGKPYSFSGLEKASVQGFEPGTPKRLKVEKFQKLLESEGIEIEQEVDVVNGIPFEMTGSPSDAGFKVKSDLIKFLASKGYVNKSLKESKFLLTDSLNSTSSKMANARKLGIEIVTYEDMIARVS